MTTEQAPHFPFATGFYGPENQAWLELLRQWDQLTQAYSNRVRFNPRLAGQVDADDDSAADAYFWHGENACTSMLQAAAWSLSASKNEAGWVAATEVSCRRAYEDGDSSGRIDLMLQSPRDYSYLVESKFLYCREGKVDWDKVRSLWQSAHEQLHRASNHGYVDPWCLAVVFLVPHTADDEEGSWDRFEKSLWSDRPHIAATSRVNEPAIWGGQKHLGVALVGSAMKWSDYKK